MAKLIHQFSMRFCKMMEHMKRTGHRVLPISGVTAHPGMSQSFQRFGNSMVTGCVPTKMNRKATKPTTMRKVQIAVISPSCVLRLYHSKTHEMKADQPENVKSLVHKGYWE